MEATHFEGFDNPEENWSKLPHSLIEALPLIETVSEFKVIAYILRHTWGFKDEEKRITLDEFANGRKRREGTRLDNGTGLTIPSIRNGLKRAIEHGFIEHHQDATDKARVKNFYSLKMKQGEKLLHPECKEDSGSGKKSLPRTEKETLETNKQERKKESPTDFGIGETDPLKGVPVATDNHQCQVDKATRGNGTDHNQEVAKHLFWGFERGIVDLPPEKKWKKWYQGGRRLRERLTQTELETNTIIKRIDTWFAEEDSPEAFWRDNPLHSTALDIIARFIKNGGKHATNHQSRRVPGRVPQYSVADPAAYGGERQDDEGPGPA